MSMSRCISSMIRENLLFCHVEDMRNRVEPCCDIGILHRSFNKYEILPSQGFV